LNTDLKLGTYDQNRNHGVVQNRFRNVSKRECEIIWAWRFIAWHYFFASNVGFKFAVDIRQHHISRYLVVNPHGRNDDCQNEYVDANMHDIKIVTTTNPITNSDYEINNFNAIYNASLMNPEPLLICTNLFCNESLTAECKQFMKTLLTPNEYFAKYITQQNELYNISSQHSILHIRLGDDAFFDNKPVNGFNVNEAANIISQYADPNDLLISDSFEFKQQLKKTNVNIAMFNTHPLHLGDLSTRFIERIEDSFKETLYEFFTLTNASILKTYSVYGHVSGFVKSAGLIYDIRLIDLKQHQPITHPENHKPKVVSLASNKSVLKSDSIRFKPIMLINRSHITPAPNRYKPLTLINHSHVTPNRPPPSKRNVIFNIKNGIHN
jgi:hypothetical protein